MHTLPLPLEPLLQRGDQKTPRHLSRFCRGGVQTPWHVGRFYRGGWPRDEQLPPL